MQITNARGGRRAAMKLEHFNITGPIELLDAVRAFYIEALGLRDGFRPAVPTRGYWLYIGDDAVVHLNENPERQRPNSPNSLDHIAFGCEDFDGMQQRLERLGIQHHVHRHPGISQIFVQDPAGTMIELNFR
jgi:catechol 2,3-dioxygenase-like lactoylglutathione lyase family enzyme